MRGYICKRGKNSWQIRYDLPRGPDGKRRQVSETIRGTKRQAENRLDEILGSDREMLAAARPKSFPAMVYAIKAPEAIKIGVTTNPETRLVDLQIGNPYRLTILWTLGPFVRNVAYDWEQKIHSRFWAHRMEGEWFRYSIDLARLPFDWEFAEDLIDYPNGVVAAEVEPVREVFAEMRESERTSGPAPAEPIEQASYAPDEAAIVLGIDEAEIDALIESGALPVIRLDTRGFGHLVKGSPTRIRHKDLVAYQNT